MRFLEKLYDSSPIFFQNLMVTVSGYDRNRSRYGKAYYDHRKFLADFDTWSLERKLEYQAEELRNFLAYAVRNSRFYRKLYDGIHISSIKTIDDLKRLPIVDKEMLRQNINDVITIPRKGAVEGHTGGTTGKSLVVLFTPEDNMKTMAMIDHFKSRVGFEHRAMKRATFNGKHIVPPLQRQKIFWRYNVACRQMIYSSFFLTEEKCGPILEKASGLKQGKDFKLGYSPERINPGDKKHRLETIVKVVSGEDQETLDTLASIYGQVVKAGIHRAPSIKVAEAAKVIENTQRDLNIALMNELALIFDKLGIRTADVLAAAGTKWNFMPFTPGLVGGHCIGVDPYYLTYKAEELGYIPQVILSGRRINDGMGKTIAEKTVKLLCTNGNSIASSRVGILGLTFKEDVPDLRNSRVPDIVQELKLYGIEPIVHDPFGDPDEALREYGIRLSPFEQMSNLDALVLAVGHGEYIRQGAPVLTSCLKDRGGVFVDVKSLFSPESFPETITYWSL